MWSPTRIGDECPGGRSVFQTTFLVGPNSTGRFLLAEMPELLGPRNCIQSSEWSRETAPARTIAIRMVFIEPRIKTIAKNRFRIEEHGATRSYLPGFDVILSA